MNWKSALLAAGLAVAVPAAAQTLYKYRHPDGRIEYSSKVVRGAVLVETIQAPAPAQRAAPAPAARGLTPGERTQAAIVDRNTQQRVSAREAAWLELRDATRALEAAEARLAAGLDPRGDELASLAGSVVPATIDPNVPQTPAISPSEAVGGPGRPEVGGAAPLPTVPVTPEPSKPAPPVLEGKAPPEKKPLVPGNEGVPPPAPKPVPGAEGTPPPAPKPNPLAERPPGRDTVPTPPATTPTTPTTPAPAAPAPNTGVGAPMVGAPPAVGGSMTARRGGGRSAEYRTRILSLEMEVAVARSRVDAAQDAYNKLR